MNKDNSYIESNWQKKDQVFERQLRPQLLHEFQGQPSIIERLQVIIGAAKQRGEHLGHLLFHGPPGLGKTTLASIVGHEMGTNITVATGPSIEKPGDLAGILTNLKEGDILFIDEIHRLNRNVEEYLYPAMEDYKLDLLLDTGPQARSVQVKLSPFTMIGATTRLGLLTGPMRTRFSFTLRLDYYPPNILQGILARSAQILNVEIQDIALLEIAKRARGTPRIANNLLRWVRDYAQIKASYPITLDIAKDALEMLSIDHKGLDELDKKYLSVIMDHHDGGPVGIQTLAAALGEDTSSLSEVNEPFLIMSGFIRRTKRGREATDIAYQHFGKKLSPNLEGNK